jgi:hypothetical protein
MIASAAICASFQGLRLQMGSLCPSKYELVQMIAEITGVDEDCLVQCQQRMEEVLQLTLLLEKSSEQVNKLMSKGEQDQSVTPTDVQDVQF